MSSLCFLGAGNMAEAILGGVLEAGVFAKEDILASDVNRERCTVLQLKYGIKTTLNRGEDLAKAHIYILAMKPQSFKEALRVLLPHLSPDCLIISILAGTSMATLEETLQVKQPEPHIVRVMPNMPALIQQGVSALCFNKHVTETEQQKALDIFASVGSTHIVEESAMDAVTAVSGSGPAYVFYFLEAFQKAAREAGLSEAQARSFCLETLMGSAQLLHHKKSDPELLRQKVTSKGGTTQAAIQVLEEAGFVSLFQQAVEAACKRSAELGR